MKPLISILIASIRKENLSRFFDNLESTLSDISACEVLVKVDIEDPEIVQHVKDEKAKRSLAIKYIETPREEGYWTLWKAYNEMAELTSEHSYFIMGLNDECRFGTQGWDLRLQEYVGFFDDNVFHLRLSPRKNIKFKSLIECIPWGESFGIFTKKWIELTEGWAIGPAGGDTGQECVNFFLREYCGHSRGIAIDDIRMADEENSISAEFGLTRSAWRRKLHKINRMYSDFLSKEGCQKFYRLALKLAIQIEQYPKYKQVSFSSNGEILTIQAHDKDKTVLRTQSYELTLGQWLEILFDVTVVTEFGTDYDRWLPRLVNQMVARRVFVEKILSYKNEDFEEYFNQHLRETYIKFFKLPVRLNQLMKVECCELDPIRDAFLEKMGYSAENQFVHELFSKILYEGDDDQTNQEILAAGLYCINGELNTRYIANNLLDTLTVEVYPPPLAPVPRKKFIKRLIPFLKN